MREQRERRGAARDERARGTRHVKANKKAIRENEQDVNANKEIEKSVHASPRRGRGLGLRTLWSRPRVDLLGGIHARVLRKVVLQ